MSRYENACSFYDKADCEGGLAEMVLGYGVGAEDLPPDVFAASEELRVAYNHFERAVKKWHDETCQKEYDWGYGPEECRW